jgi:acyl-CoA synthetase (AMP-forming)/AMP-acid ligase II
MTGQHRTGQAMTGVGELVQRRARERPEAAYLVDCRRHVTVCFGELGEACRSIAAELDRAGIPRGAPVALELAEPIAFATVYLALLCAGLIAVPLDPGAPPAELARVSHVAHPVALLSEHDEPRSIELPGTDRPIGIRLLGEWSLGSRDAAPAGEGVPGGGEGVPEGGGPGGGAGPDGDGGVLLCTSGTTGAPKGIRLRPHQLLSVARSVAEVHRLSEEDRGFSPLPLFHINAEVVGLLGSLVPETPPPAFVRFVRSASAPLPAVTLRRFEKAYKIPVVETYGMTEAASMITANPLLGPRKPGSAGLPVGVELVVVDDAGRYAGPGVVGRVKIRGTSVVTSYVGGARADAFDADGWLDTFDLGYLDHDGYLFLVGRADDVINRGGENIYPREIEEVLVGHPLVEDAVVVGIPDPVLGARPTAYVVPTEPHPAGSDLARELRAACEEALSAYKVPAAIHLVDALPVGATGKVARRRVLTELGGVAL